MHIFHNLEEWISHRRTFAKDLTLGFVPTMGNLHAGHLSLVQTSKKENDRTVVSIFVNPTQFNHPEDFNHYPRSLDADLRLLEEAGVDYCLLPSEQAIYKDAYRYQVQDTDLSQLMEGQWRPGHFTGVLTIVLKLLNLTQPTGAYFGEKDYQQYLLIHDMVNAFFMDIEIRVCPTIREDSGLAYSSRNNRLSPVQRLVAEQFAQIFHQSKPLNLLLAELGEHQIQVEYLEEYQNRRFAAVKIGDVRLIDNYLLSL